MGENIHSRDCKRARTEETESTGEGEPGIIAGGERLTAAIQILVLAAGCFMAGILSEQL